MKLSKINLSTLEASPDSGPVWVINSSKGDRRGDVILIIARAQGIGSDSIIVPATFVPMNLTGVVSRAQLLRDNQFRQSLTRGLLTLVDADDCERYFEEDEDARIERDRLNNYMLVGGVAFQQDQSSGEVEVFAGSRGKASEFDIPAQIDDLVQRIEMSVKDGLLTDEAESDYARKLKSLGEMDTSVYEHVFNKTKRIAPVVASAAKKLAGR